tara:strand:- start:4187 stop:4459 length:273 start_codon:yes stop_codon:yes gene_type:complete
MNLTNEKIHLFDMPWTDDADYEHIFEDRLHDYMLPFFRFEDAKFTKEVDFKTDYKPIAKVYGEFMSEASSLQFMLKFSDELNKFRTRRSW